MNPCAGVKIEDGEYGRRAVITSAWSDEMTRYLVECKIAELELIDANGWRGSNLLFLRAFPKLRSFSIIDLTISSVEPIHFLHELKALKVITYCKTEIAFEAFPQLEDCSLEWRPKATSLFDCVSLKRLFVNRYKGKDVNPFGNLDRLESLAILNAPVANLRGLSPLNGLRSLRIANFPKLNSLAGLEELVNLEKLEIHTCRAFDSIEEIGFLSKLKVLNLNNDGKIKSLKPLENLDYLESVAFYESTDVVDGNLTPLLNQKHLSRVAFHNRRHYSHKRDEFVRRSMRPD